MKLAKKIFEALFFRIKNSVLNPKTEVCDRFPSFNFKMTFRLKLAFLLIKKNF